MGFAINPPNTRLVDENGVIDPVWYRFFAQLQKILGNDLVSQIQNASVLTYSSSPILLNQRVLAAGTALTVTVGPSLATLDLDDTAVTPASYGSSTEVARFTVDQQGRLTNALGVTISASGIGALVAANNLSDLASVITARSNLGLGSIATQNANNVTITGGSVSGITDIAVADGGTGASTAAGARTNLGVAIGSDVQAWDADLDALAALSGTNTIYYRSAANTWTGVTIGGSLSFSGGTLNTAKTLDAGTYTPTLTNVANIDSTTAYQCQYMRVGNVVTVSGKLDIDPTAAATPTQVGISLPIASNLGAREDCAGSGCCNTISQPAAIRADFTNDRAELDFISTTTLSSGMFFSFTYELI